MVRPSVREFLTVIAIAIAGLWASGSKVEAAAAGAQSDQRDRGAISIEPVSSLPDGAAEAEDATGTTHRKAPTTDVSVPELRRRLGDEFRRIPTNHFLILSDADMDTIQRLASTLERTHHQFVRACRRMRLETSELPRRFPCVLFRRRDDFREYARKHDGVVADWVGGYYASRGNFMVFYLAADDPEFIEADEQLEAYEREIARIHTAIRDARRARRTDEARRLSDRKRRLERHLNKERSRIRDLVEQHADARTVHETVHLLAFNMGVQSRRRVPPFWLSEGLAMNFETFDIRSAFGPDFEEPRRRERFEELLRDEALMPLGEFITRIDVAEADEARSAEVMYHQAYGLFRYLYRMHRDELARCMRFLASTPADPGALPEGRLTPGEYRAVFEEAFGPVEALERAWLRHERMRLAASERD